MKKNSNCTSNKYNMNNKLGCSWEHFNMSSNEMCLKAIQDVFFLKQRVLFIDTYL